MSTETERYLKIVKWVRRRYTTPDGYLVKYVGEAPSIYTRIEQLAFDRYFKAI